MNQNNSTTAMGPQADQRAMKILAKSVYRELRSSGASRLDVVGFTNLLLDLITSESLQEQNAAPAE